jgi:hypothetical protein
LQEVLADWLRHAVLDNKTVLCLPAQSSGVWLAAAVLPSEHPLLNDIECNPAVEASLPRLPKKQRIRKTTSAYRQHKAEFTAQWETVKELCSQARQFEQALLTAL